jgi:hypothetical protein
MCKTRSIFVRLIDPNPIIFFGLAGSQYLGTGQDTLEIEIYSVRICRAVGKEEGRDDVLQELDALAECGKIYRAVGILRAADVYWNRARQPVLCSIVEYGEEEAAGGTVPVGDGIRIVARPYGR